MVWNVSTNGPQRQWAVDGRQHGHAEGPRLWELLLKAAHADGSCSPKCQSLSAFPREGSNELHQLSAARAQGADAVSPGPAGWAGPGSCWPTVTRATSPSHTAPCSGQSDRTLTDGLVLEGAQDTVLSSLWCLPLAASEEQRPTWPQLLLSTAGASQLDVDRQIPPQSGWCFTFLLYMPEEVQKNPHHSSKQATTTSPFKASGSSWVNWGTEWGFPASQGLPWSCWTARPWANLCSSASASLLFCWAGYLEGFCRWPPSN